MKTKTLSMKSVGDNTPIVLGAVGGAMLGRGITSVIAKPSAVPTQNEANKKMYVQLAMAVGGFLGYAVVDGNDTTANTIKGVALGVAIDNTINVVSTLVNKSNKVKSALVADTTVNRFAKAALGLGCADCENSSRFLNAPRRRNSRRLGTPIFNEPTFNEPTFEQIISAQRDLASN